METIGEHIQPRTDYGREHGDNWGAHPTGLTTGRSTKINGEHV